MHCLVAGAEESDEESSLKMVLFWMKEEIENLSTGSKIIHGLPSEKKALLSSGPGQINWKTCKF